MVGCRQQYRNLLDGKEDVSCSNFYTYLFTYIDLFALFKFIVYVIEIIVLNI